MDLIKLCAISAIAGIIILIIISDKMGVPSSNISSISAKDINKVIKITGTVKKFTDNERVAFIEIEDKSGTIKTIVFKPRELSLKKGSTVEIEGKIAVKEGLPEIYVEKIKIIN